MPRYRINDLYRDGRSFPEGRNTEPHPNPPDAARYHDHQEIQAPQFREDAHGPAYSNDVSIKSWLRNGDATSKENFDFGNSWRRADKGDKR